MLNELREFEENISSNSNNLDDRDRELLKLGDHLMSENQKRFHYRDHVVLLKGIPEDFKIFLDGELVCECVYDTVYRQNRTLIDLLLS